MLVSPFRRSSSELIDQGLMLLQGEPRAATVRATSDCITFALDRDTFRKIMMQQGKSDMQQRVTLLGGCWNEGSIERACCLQCWITFECWACMIFLRTTLITISKLMSSSIV